MTVALVDRASKQLGSSLALDDVSVAIGEASTVALLGPNGAGKSTLVSLLLGLRSPDSGTVCVAGGDPRRQRIRHAVGVALQELRFPATLRVEEVARFVAAHRRGTPDVGDVLGRFGLAQLARRQTGGLSGGERRRLGVALAFVGRPRLVVLDEPTASLDVEGRAAVWDAIAASRQDGSAILVATHDVAEAEVVATDVVALHRGRVVATGSVGDVRLRAGRTRVAYGGDGGRVTLDVADAAETVAALVRAGTRLHDLEVRPLTLQESLARLDGARA